MNDFRLQASIILLLSSLGGRSGIFKPRCDAPSMGVFCCRCADSAASPMKDETPEGWDVSDEAEYFYSPSSQYRTGDTISRYNFSNLPPTPGRRYADFMDDSPPDFSGHRRAHRDSRYPRIPVHKVGVSPNHRVAHKVQLLRGIDENTLDKRQRSLFCLVEALFRDPRGYHMDIDHSYLPGICYRIYSVAPFEGHFATPVALFKPANLEIGTKYHTKWLEDQTFWVKLGTWAHAKSFPPGTGVLREYICYLMHKKLTIANDGIGFSVPSAVLVEIGCFGAGLLQEYVIPPFAAGGSPGALHPYDSIIENQMQFIFTILTMKSSNGLQLGRIRALNDEHLDRVRFGMHSAHNGDEASSGTLPSHNSFYRSGIYSVHNSLALPETETLSPLTDLAMRRLRLPFGNLTFAPPIVRLIESLDADCFDDIYSEFGVGSIVKENVEIARRVLRLAVLRHNFTPIQVMRFLYTDRPVSFYSLSCIRLERPTFQRGTADFWKNFDVLLQNTLQRVRPLNQYQCEHPEAADHTDCESFQSDALGLDALKRQAGGLQRSNDAIVADGDVNDVLGRMWSGEPVPVLVRLRRRFLQWADPIVWWVSRLFLCEFRY